METSLVDAPGSGAGLGKKVAEALLADERFVPLMKAAIIDGLEAKAWFYDKNAKEWHGEPDPKTRLQAFFGAMSHLVGDPIKRVMTASVGPGGAPGADLEAALLQSPAYRAALRKQLDRADRLARKKGGPQTVDLPE